MKFVVIAVLFLAYSQAAELNSQGSKGENGNTEKRALTEGNAGTVEKREPSVSTVLPGSVSPGIEYAVATEASAEKSPQQQVYVTPLPQVKISDVLSGQGPPFPAAIATHLYSPISVYQARLGSPTTYQVSAPIPSQLAYTEHKITFPASQYYPQNFNQKLQPKSPNFQTYSHEQPNPQQINYRTPQISLPVYPQYHSSLPGHPHIYQTLPFQQKYSFNSNTDQRNQKISNPEQSSVQIISSVQPGITYVNQEKAEDLKITQESNVPTNENLKLDEKQNIETTQSYNTNPQVALSFPSFSLTQPVLQQQHQLPENELHYPAQILTHFQEPFQLRNQLQTQPHYNNQIQPQYQTHVQATQKHSNEASYQANQIQHQLQNYVDTSTLKTDFSNLPVALSLPQTFIRTDPLLHQIQPQFYQNQFSPSQNQPFYQRGYYSQPLAHLATTPTFPEVQYFGKFAHSIFQGLHN